MSLRGLLTMLIMSLLFLFALMKLQFLLLRKILEVVMFVDEKGVPADYERNMRDEPFMMAFSLRQKGPKTDDNYL